MTSKSQALVFAIVFCTGLGFYSPLHAQKTVEDDDMQVLVRRFMDKLATIFEGNDPFNYKGSSTTSNSYGTYLNGSIDDMILTGIGTMNTTGLSVVEIGQDFDVQLNLTFDELVVTGDYYLDFDALTMLKLYGSGELGAKFSSISLNISATVNAGDVLQFKTFAIALGLPIVEVDIKNLLNRPAMGTLASRLISDLLPLMLNQDDRLQKLLSSKIKSNLNTLCDQHNITLAFVIQFIKKFTE